MFNRESNEVQHVKLTKCSNTVVTKNTLGSQWYVFLVHCSHLSQVAKVLCHLTHLQKLQKV